MKFFDEISAAAPAMRSGVMTAASPAWRGVKAWIAIGLALSIVTMPDAHARIYKWVDADGNVQYSQTPPPEGQFNEINPGPPPSQSADEANRQLQDTLQRQDESEKQTEADKLKKKEMASKQAKMDQVCGKAKNDLAVLETYTGHRIGVMENGAVVRRMSEDERQAKMAELKKVISEFCE